MTILKRLYLYYDMKLVTFGKDDKRNLIVQFPLFVHPYNQQCLTLYQLETVPVPIIDRNENAQSCTHLKVTKPYIALNSETYISLRIQELETCEKILIQMPKLLKKLVSFNIIIIKQT